MPLRKSLVAVAILFAVTSLAVQTNTLPSEISDKEFWRLIADLSEPGGSYPYENFVSNELQVQDVIPALKAITKPGAHKVWYEAGKVVSNEITIEVRAAGK